jgi:hypothetical protein
MIAFGGYISKRSVQMIPFRPEHALKIKLKSLEIQYVNKMPDYINYIISNAVPDLSWTLVKDGSIIALFGVRIMWPGVAEVWMLPGQEIKENAIPLIKGGRYVLDVIEHELGMKRLQIAVLKSDYTAYKFARMLYFTSESVMHKFGPYGEDYYMMTRIR